MTEPAAALIRRIEELENQLAFQDELYEALNAVVARQDGEILELKRQLGLLSDRLKEMAEMSPGAQPQDETPPHY